VGLGGVQDFVEFGGGHGVFLSGCELVWMNNSPQLNSAQFNNLDDPNRKR
jgi:hypothetical protein